MCFAWKPGHSEFVAMEVRDTSLRSSLMKNIYLCHDFEPFLKIRHMEKCLSKCVFVLY